MPRGKGVLSDVEVNSNISAPMGNRGHAPRMNSINIVQGNLYDHLGASQEGDQDLILQEQRSNNLPEESSPMQNRATGMIKVKKLIS